MIIEDTYETDDGQLFQMVTVQVAVDGHLIFEEDFYARLPPLEPPYPDVIPLRKGDMLLVAKGKGRSRANVGTPNRRVRVAVR